MSNRPKTASIKKNRHKTKYSTGTYTVYTIRVRIKESGEECLYVGRSKKFNERLKQHKRKSTAISHYTKKDGQCSSEYELLEVVETEEFEELDKAQYRERQRMVELAHEHGVGNVAGGG